MKEFKNTLEPFAVGYLNEKSENASRKIANGMLEYAKYLPLDIDPENYFAGWFAGVPDIGVRYTYGNGIEVYPDIIEKEMQDNPGYIEELSEILEKMQPLCTKQYIQSKKDELFGHPDSHFAVGWGGDGAPGWGGHSNPGYDILIDAGTDGIREKIKKYRAINTGKDDFYDAQEMALEAIDVLCGRYGALAADMAKTAAGENKKTLARIAEAFENIPQKPPRDFFEACQYFWMLFTFDGIDSPGRFDRYMIKYYRGAKESDRKYCLDRLWQLFYKQRVWNLCLAGSDEEWNDEANELTYDILEVARKYRYNTPNITVRVHRNTPDSLWRSIAETIGTGIGMPAIYNDEVVCPALEALDIPPCDSHDYCMNGCNQIDIFGKSHMGLEDGEINLAKCVQLALRDGVCQVLGKQLGVKTGNPARFADFDEFMAAYKKQIEFLIDTATRHSNDSQKIYAEMFPNPFRSNMFCGCLEKGMDMKAGGTLYNNGQILMEGIADAADSIAALKHFVYDTKKYTMKELCDALEADFEGYDQLHNDFSTYHKFGNEYKDVDSIYSEIVTHFAQYLLTKKPFRGGKFGAGCSTFSRAANYGAGTGSLPNGKKKTSTLFADSIGAVPGCDEKGPTAVMNSVLGVDHKLAKSGFVLQMKFNKDTFNTETGINAFINLAKTYTTSGGQQLSVNVVSLKELLDAQKNPDAHKDLVVRVGGFSEYFNKLSPGLQENIIKRTQQTI